MCERNPYKLVEAPKKKSEERARAEPGVSGGIPYLVHHNPSLHHYVFGDFYSSNNFVVEKEVFSFILNNTRMKPTVVFRTH